MATGERAGGELSAFLAALRRVESGGNYRAHNPSGASGAYQFIDSTWGGYGGYRRAMDAPRAVQDRRAEQLVAQYFHRYHRWDLVAVAWHGGQGLADRARHDPGLIRRVSDGNITTAEYVRRVMAAMPASARTPAHTPNHQHHGTNHGTHHGTKHRTHEVAPWRLPQHGGGRMVAIEPHRLHDLARQLTDHVAVAEQVYHQCRLARAEAQAGGAQAGGGRLAVVDNHLEARLRAILDDLLDGWEGLRRLPYLLTRDLGYVVEVRRLVLRADQGEARHTLEGLIGTLAGHPPGNRRRTAALVSQLFHEPTTSTSE